MSIVIANRQHARKVNRRLLKQITATLLADLEVENAELGVHLIAAPEMIRLNEKFLRHRGSTDVITFDNRNSEFGIWSSEFQLHGEIFICVNEAVRQARQYGTTWQSEIVRYIVHGILHLLGSDDARAGARREMKREEDRRMRELSRRFPLSKL
jgi:rRNA maturation RNase YbeY